MQYWFDCAKEKCPKLVNQLGWSLKATPLYSKYHEALIGANKDVNQEVRVAKTNYITDWETWKELCEQNEVDPYEFVEFGIDEGGGNSTDFEYTGDIPKEGGMNE